ncbi:hypothetical protein AJ80_03537 [Polytolypa hystricis UAMH7299]|uniref:MAGE domain-containing protein n=1 Tax=Polytolypa hystricis (strain UAMH7299) TaxID=1447883 RepID=A0A2B7YHQ0_POLH7|nr:hypothetical protein AJ80_03537 [Polytolypa hystricis UAMH7299]
MAPSRKRRAQEESSDGSSSDAPSEPPATQRRRRAAASDDDASASDSDAPGGTQSLSGRDVMVKKLVRLALASEYSRQVIRRNDISVKVLGEQGSRQFKPVFECAQKVLKSRFGMQMVEQPMREKFTISQRRAAQRTDKPSTTSKTWTVVTTLPPAYRIPAILPPPKAPSSTTESQYVALYTFIISIIMLCGGSVLEEKLDRYLRRMNAENYTPLDRTDRLLTRMCKEGYIVRNRDVDGGEEVIEYMVGPRGKVEVGIAGVSGLVTEVFGFGSENGNNRQNGNREEADEDSPFREFEEKLNRSLGIRERIPDDEDDEGGHNGGGEERPRRSRRVNGDDSD